MSAIAGQLQSPNSVVAILATVLAVFSRVGIACRMRAFLIFRHFRRSFQAECITWVKDRVVTVASLRESNAGRKAGDLVQQIAPV